MKALRGWQMWSFVLWQETPVSQRQYEMRLPPGQTPGPSAKGGTDKGA